MVMRTMQALTGGLVAGVVLRTHSHRRPTRHDTMEVRMASCVLASLLMASGADATAAKAGAAANSLTADTIPRRRVVFPFVVARFAQSGGLPA